MKQFSATANASYIQHQNRDLLRAAAHTYFTGLGYVLFSVNPTSANPNVWLFTFEPIDEVEQAVTQEDVDDFMENHDNSGQTEGQIEEEELANASEALRTLMLGLNGLPAGDAAYAAIGRAYAMKDGASQATIDGIVDRTTAATYVTGKAEWAALITATNLANMGSRVRAWEADTLDMFALLLEPIVILLRR
jgi:hypothetical protein